MILRGARAVCGRPASSSTTWPRSLWCRFTKCAGHRSHECSADSTSSPHNREMASSEISLQVLPVSMSRMVTIAEWSHVGALSLGKGRFDLLIRKRRVHLLQPLVLDGWGVTGTSDERSLYSWLECGVGLILCGTQYSLVATAQ